MTKKTFQSEYGSPSVPKRKEKQEEAIIGTNDYSIVSKRSVEKLYFPDEPEFLRPFVAKLKRRAPLINRGYWLRMRAIEHVVKKFLDERTKPKIIINLGCGFEPLPFRMLWKYSNQCHGVMFVDMDFPQLIQKKEEIIRKTPMFGDLLSRDHPGTPPRTAREKLFENERYRAVGCDLGDLSKVQDAFRELRLDDHAVLFIAEVSLVYMDPDHATKLLEVCRKSKDARFCLLEQHLPAGEGHPFANTMLDHFRKQTPLRGIDSYSNLRQQTDRFCATGWGGPKIIDLWSLWCDEGFIDNNVKANLDSIEPFDEWEEFAMFGGHYFVLTATTPTTNYGCSFTPFRSDWEPASIKEPTLAHQRAAAIVTLLKDGADIERDVIRLQERVMNMIETSGNRKEELMQAYTVYKCQRQNVEEDPFVQLRRYAHLLRERDETITERGLPGRVDFKRVAQAVEDYYTNAFWVSTMEYEDYRLPTSRQSFIEAKILAQESPGGHGLRRSISVLSIDDETFSFHGDSASLVRQAHLNIHSSPEDIREACSPPEGTIYHTITNFGDKRLLVGGRTSPAKASQKCWLQDDGKWVRTYDLYPARYRHCSVAITVDSMSGVLTFGGRTSESGTLNDWSLFTSSTGWQDVKLSPAGLHPPPLFGAAMIATGEYTGMLLGGMSGNGVLAPQSWQWELAKTENGDFELLCNKKYLITEERGLKPDGVERFGASLIHSQWGILLIGGIGPRGPLNMDEEILLFRDNGDVEWCGKLIESVMPRPLLVGFGVTTLSGGSVMIAGGSAVCFSFGSCSNDRCYILQPKDSKDKRCEWKLVSSEKGPATAAPSSRPKVAGAQDNVLTSDDGHGSAVSPKLEPRALKHTTKISRILIRNNKDFQDLLSASTPIVLENLNFGPCTQLWTPEYLKSQIGPSRPVTIHSASTRHLSFLTKNFTYTTMPFSSFIDAAVNGSHIYLRALSSSQPSKLPANLATDFPALAPDFSLPDSLAFATEHEHSSVLRISGDVNMWLHYDVMANLLCQVRGSKRIVLFPPKDVSALGFPHGDTTSGVDVFGSTGEQQLEGVLRDTCPVETVLNQGEILFIPACWPHATAPNGQGDGVSVAVNVFFRSLGDAGGYAAGRDVYANRDLEVYQNGRRDVGRIVNQYHGNIATDDIETLVETLRDGKKVDSSVKGSKEVERMVKSAAALPKEIGKFYRTRLADELLDGLRGSGESEVKEKIVVTSGRSTV